MAMPDIDGVVQAWRNEVAEAAAVDEVVAANTPVDFSKIVSPFLSYRVNDVQIQGPGTGHGYAVNDTVATIPVDLFYARKDEAGTEGLSEVRTALMEIADAVAGAPRAHEAWVLVPEGLTGITVTGLSQGEFEAWFVEHVSGWTGSMVSFEMTVIV